MMKDTIVITGGAGFVGSNLIALLLKATKFKFISLDNYSSGHKKKPITNDGLLLNLKVYVLDNFYVHCI